MKKYELKYELIEEEGTGLYRVRSLIDIPEYGINIGDLGGRIERKDNISYEENAWVLGDARVLGNARVSEYAQVSGNAQISGFVKVSGNVQVSEDARVSGCVWITENAKISGKTRISGNAQVSGNVQISKYTQISGDALITSNRDFITVGPIGSRNDYVTAYKTKDGSFGITTGCFTGSIEEFRNSLNGKHKKDSTHWKEYTKMCRFVEGVFNKK